MGRQLWLRLLRLHLLLVVLFAVVTAADLNPYKVLGVSRGASVAEIKTAYKSLAKQHHPDKNSGQSSAEAFIQVTQAYELLSDPEKRRNYDRFGVADDQPRWRAAHGNERRFHSSSYLGRAHAFFGEPANHRLNGAGPHGSAKEAWFWPNPGHLSLESFEWRTQTVPGELLSRMSDGYPVFWGRAGSQSLDSMSAGDLILGASSRGASVSTPPRSIHGRAGLLRQLRDLVLGSSREPPAGPAFLWLVCVYSDRGCSQCGRVRYLFEKKQSLQASLAAAGVRYAMINAEFEPDLVRKLGIRQLPSVLGVLTTAAGGVSTHWMNPRLIRSSRLSAGDVLQWAGSLLLNETPEALVVVRDERDLRDKFLPAVLPSYVRIVRPSAKAPVVTHRSWDGRTTVAILSRSAEPSFLLQALASRLSSHLRILHVCLGCFQSQLFEDDDRPSSGGSVAKTLSGRLSELAKRVRGPAGAAEQTYLPFLTPEAVGRWRRLSSATPARSHLLLVQREPTSPTLLLDSLQEILETPARGSTTAAGKSPSVRLGALAELMATFRSPVLPELTEWTWQELFETSDPFGDQRCPFLSAVMQGVPAAPRLVQEASGGGDRSHYWGAGCRRPRRPTTGDPAWIMVLVTRSWTAAWETVVRPLLAEAHGSGLSVVGCDSSDSRDEGWCAERPGIILRPQSGHVAVAPVWVGAEDVASSAWATTLRQNLRGCAQGALIYHRGSQGLVGASTLCFDTMVLGEEKPVAEAIRNWLEQTVGGPRVGGRPTTASSTFVPSGGTRFRGTHGRASVASLGHEMLERILTFQWWHIVLPPVILGLLRWMSRLGGDRPNASG